MASTNGRSSARGQGGRTHNFGHFEKFKKEVSTRRLAHGSAESKLNPVYNKLAKLIVAVVLHNGDLQICCLLVSN